MKKNFLYSLLAVFGMLFASCSQEEIVSTSGTGSNDGMVRLSVNVSDEALVTRASQSLDVEGYVMRCICQAVNAEGTLIEGFNEIVAVTDGKASFEFEAPEGAANYLFWADYVEGSDIEASKSALYNATSLLEVKYNLNKNVKLFNNPAADAFCAVASAANIGGSITLKRPFSRIAIKASDLEKLGLTGLDIITPSINAMQGYSVLNQTASAAVTLQLNINETLNVSTGDLAFYCYVFPVNSTVTKNTNIKFTSASDEIGKSISITAAEMQEKASSSNNAVYLTPDEDNPVQPGDETIKVDIIIDNEYTGEEGGTEEPGTDPTPSTELAVGDYINANGEKVATAEEAIAVVFALGGQNDNSTYAEGKTVEAYAMSLNKATNRNRVDTYTDLGLAVTDDAANAYAGLAFSTAIETALGTASDATAYQMFNSFFNNSLVEATASENLSEWYIPSLAQLQAALATTNADLIAALKAAYTGNYYCASSTVTAEGLQGIIYNITDGTSGSPETIGTGASAVVFPVVTIFE